MALRLKKRLRKSAHLPPPIIFRDVLTAVDMEEVYSFVQQLREEQHASGPHEQEHAAGPRDDELPAALAGESSGDEEDGPEPGSEQWLQEQMRLTAQLSAAYNEPEDEPDDVDLGGVDDDAPPASWVVCSEAHQKVFLHHGGRMRDGAWRTFADACPGVLSKLLELMNSTELYEPVWRAADTPWTAPPKLNIRCVEFHEYTAGGGLDDPGHIDVGSALTLSVQLSEPEPAAHGGRFTSTDASGLVTTHELARGDAVLFCSEMVHNVARLTHGVRNSLVIELWTEPPNTVDRHK